MASKKLKLKPRRDNYMLRDGRPVQMVPWIAKTAQPWRSGYARVFIPFTPHRAAQRSQREDRA